MKWLLIVFYFSGCGVQTVTIPQPSLGTCQLTGAAILTANLEANHFTCQETK